MKKNTLQEIVNRIIWNQETAKIIYLDRKNGIYKEITNKDLLKAGTEFIFLKNGNVIPYQRIQSIEILGRKIFKK